MLGLFMCSVLQASSWVEQEQLDERLTDMESQKAQLAADLQANQASTLLCDPHADPGSRAGLFDVNFTACLAF
jgi:hypothetical protein